MAGHELLDRLLIRYLHQKAQEKSRRQLGLDANIDCHILEHIANLQNTQREMNASDRPMFDNAVSF
jgi:hypothetical protein